MTPAQHLRKAAQLARETAERAMPGPWHADRRSDGRVWIDSPLEPRMIPAHGYPSTAAHIALWSPPVALVVAVMLEDAATLAETMQGAGWDKMFDLDPALAVADALLQTQPVKP